MSGERIATSCVCCGDVRLESSPAVLMPFVAHRVFGWTPVEIDESWGLETIPKGRAYSICRSLRCSACGHLFLDIRFDDAELRRLYEGYRNPEYVALREHYEPGYRLRNATLREGVPYVPSIEKFLTPYVPSAPRVLDWGGDTGRNTPFASTRSSHLVYDISDVSPIAGARRVALDELTPTDYDLICCSMVLEHVPFPVVLLEEIRRAMDEDTVLYVEVPYENLMLEHPTSPHLYKRHWHEHINFFSRRSLRAALERAGFVVVAEDEVAAVFEGRQIHVMQAACRIASPHR